MKTHVHKSSSIAPCCGARIGASTSTDTAADEDSRPPAPGDFSVCWHCGAMQRYADEGLRVATMFDLWEFQRHDPRGHARMKSLQKSIKDRIRAAKS